MAATDTKGPVLFQAIYDRWGDLFVILLPAAVSRDPDKAARHTTSYEVRRFLKASGAIATGQVMTTYPNTHITIHRAWLAGLQIGLISGPWLEWYLTLGQEHA